MLRSRAAVRLLGSLLRGVEVNARCSRGVWCVTERSGVIIIIIIVIIIIVVVVVAAAVAVYTYFTVHR